MKALKALPSDEMPIAESFTLYTYEIRVKDGIVQNHPSYVRVGDDVTWTIEGVVPSSVTIAFFSPETSFFTSMSRIEDLANSKVTIEGRTVRAAVGTKITYEISGTLFVPVERSETQFSTETMELMADDSGKPPGCYGCPRSHKPPRPRQRLKAV